MHRPKTKSNPAPKLTSVAVARRLPLPAWLTAVLLALVTVALYWPATSHGFADYDDNFYVTENSHVQGGLTWAGAKWAFLNPVAGNWHPLTVLSHMLDCQLFGLNPWGHHLTSVLLHAVNTVLVFLLLLRLTGLRPERRRSCGPAGGSILAECDGGGVVRVASGACGIGGVGGGAQGCAEHVFWPANPDCLCAICGEVQSPKSKVQSLVWFSPVIVCVGLDEQGDAGDMAVCPAAAGLVAVAKSFKFQVFSFKFRHGITLNPQSVGAAERSGDGSTLNFGFRKAAIFCPGGGDECGDVRGAAA